MIQPKVFGKFILLERVSVGGMAEVYRAKLLDAPNFERFFAIKRILPHLAKDTEFVTMFINEAKVAVELEHPNVCQIYELGRLGQSHYIAMEYIAGRDVEAIQAYYRKQKKIMSVSQACFIMAQAAQGLDYAHRAVEGLVHRDVSPQNLLVTYDGVVKLIDFGVSKASRKTAHSKSGVVKGKFSYMSPEQATDGQIDHRSDIFAIGVIFWELLTGRRLFQSESEFAIMEMISECKVEKPSKYNRMIPEAVERICMKALEKDVTKRYQSGNDMVVDLFEFINSCKTPFTQWHLQTWMCKVFADELDAEWKKIPIFKGINTSEDIEKYNREHAPSVSEGAPVAEAKTEDSSALPEDILSQISPSVSEKSDAESPKPSDSQVAKKVPEKRTGPRIIEAKSANASDSLANKVKAGDSGAVKVEGGTPSLPPVPGRGPRIVPSIVKAKTETPKETENANDASKDTEPSETKEASRNEKPEKIEPPRLEIEAKATESEEDIEFEPEGIGPDVSDPQLVRRQKEAKRNRMQKILMCAYGTICALCLVFPVLVVLNVVPLPKPEIQHLTSASIQIKIEKNPANQEVVKELDLGEEATIEVYLDPKESNPTPITTAKGSQVKLENLNAGEYAIDIALPGYAPESYKVLVENKNYEATLYMTQVLPQTTEYTVHVTPDDARIYVNDKLIPGNGSNRTIQGIVGNEYTIKALKVGHAPKDDTIKLVENMDLSFDLGAVMPVRLQIETSPRGCEVMIKENGSKIPTRRDLTPKTFENVKTNTPIEIEVRKPGYETWRRVVDFDKLEYTTDIRLFADLKAQ